MENDDSSGSGRLEGGPPPAVGLSRWRGWLWGLPTGDDDPRQTSFPAFPVVALIAILLISVPVFLAGRGAALDQLTIEGTAAAQLRVQSLESVLAKQRAVAAILSDDRAVQDLLRAGPRHKTDPASTDAVSIKLNRLRDETQSAVIYLLDRTGLAIAASNWDAPDSFVGVSYAFRDYFTKALTDVTALQFALGSVSHRAGLYLSHDVRDNSGLIGVIVVKVEFDALEAVWARSPSPTWVTGPGDMVYLSGEPSARFAPLPELPRGMMAITAPVPGASWQLVLGVPTGSANWAGLFAAGVVALILGAAATGFGWVQRARTKAMLRAALEHRRRAELEQAVTERTRELRDEMQERQHAEQRLARLQSDLVQANKLATLGQITAGLAHEINTPLATIRLLAENGRALLPKRAPADLVGNLDSIVRMSERIARITTELRGFSRKATGQTAPVTLTEVFEASLLLINSRRRAEPARILLPRFDPRLTVLVEAVRLEQVLVNLIQNAHEALSGHAEPEIRIGVEAEAARVVLTVSDNGPGIAPQIAAQLFTPFATSKHDGVGLGLVIAQGIVRDFGGELVADPPAPGQGATFRLDLPRGPDLGAAL